MTTRAGGERHEPEIDTDIRAAKPREKPCKLTDGGGRCPPPPGPGRGACNAEARKVQNTFQHVALQWYAMITPVKGENSGVSNDEKKR